ncbi:hemicentin-1-like [Glandiceps talaboti]
MNCSIPKGAPPGELVWYDDNGDGQRGGNKSTNLWTKVFTKEDNGTRLNCELDHKTLPPPGGNRVNCKDDRIIIVQYPYVVNISSALSSILVEGGSYIAECTIEDIGTPSTLFRPLYWVGPHEEIYNDDILVITNVSRDEAGVYKCIAENKYSDDVTIGTGSATVSLDVQYPPELSIHVTDMASDDGTTIEGQSFTVECSVTDANPDTDHIMWLSDHVKDVNITDFSVLYFDNVTREDDQNYTCIAQNTLVGGIPGNGSATVDIDVQYVSQMEIQDDSNGTVIEGQDYNGMCKVDSNPVATLSWRNDTQTVSVNGILSILSAKRYDAVNYECAANVEFWDNSTEQMNLSMRLNVQYKPHLAVMVIGDASEDGKVIDGTTNVSIKCEVEESNPQVWFTTWTDTEEDEPLLRFDTIDLDDHGTYTCKSNNTFWDGTQGQGQTSINIDVQYPPIVNIVENRGIAVEGKVFTAYCNAIANPTAAISWIHRGALNTSGEELNIEDVTRDHSGEYICQAVNTYWNGSTNTVSDDVTLDVQYPPSVEVLSPLVVCKERETVTLSCSVVDANPMETNLTWILQNGNIYSNANVSLDDIKRELSGNYTCDATNIFYDNSVGYGSGVTTVDVQYYPDVSVKLDLVRCKEGDDITLECTVDSNPPPSETKWTKDGVTKSNSLIHAINDVKRDDMGVYNCTAKIKFYDGADGIGFNVTNVIVEHFPIVHIFGPENATIENSSNNLTCTAMEGLPSPSKIELVHVNDTGPTIVKTEEAEEGEGVTTLTYTMEKTERWRNGSYYCNATTKFYDDSEDSEIGVLMDMLVYYVPGILNTDNENTVMAEIGETAELICRVDAYPDATITWKDKSGGRDVIEFEGTVTTSTLTLNKVKKSDFKTYTCTITNGVGELITHDVKLSETIAEKITDDLDVAAISGISAGIFLLLIMVIMLSVLVHRQRKKKRQRPSGAELTALDPVRIDDAFHSGETNTAFMRSAPDGGGNNVGNLYTDNTSTFQSGATNDNNRMSKNVEDMDDENVGATYAKSSKTPRRDQTGANRGSIIYADLDHSLAQGQQRPMKKKPETEETEYAKIDFAKLSKK